MKRNINCDECGKFLFETEKENNGAAGVQAQDNGFVYKNACLFSDKYSSLFFCNHDCGKAFYAKNIKKDEVVTQKLNEFKADIPRMTTEICEGMQKITDAFNKINNNHDRTKNNSVLRH